ncbi:MAG TPA: NAD-binding protein, partial [Tepidisphaeraceae bacterium]|nr:NAD-binding protein [Tepidisphaeraceae bacterium]
DANPLPLTDHAVIAGFGVPGRTVADELKKRGVPYCVIELNPETVRRCGHVGVPIIEGNATDEAVLRHAGVETASLIVLAVPNEPVVLAAVTVCRRLNPHARIVARCNFTSGGLEALRRGADQTVVAEQVVATALSDVIRHPAPHKVGPP